jgi:Protein of unknown function (DUF3761)
MSLLKKAVLWAFLLIPAFLCAQNIPASDAGKHLGEQATVCGRIAETHTANTSQGVPTFIDFERSYPNQTFTAVIWQRDKASVGALPRVGVLCVTGTIIDYHGRPEITLHSRSDWSSPQAKLSNDNRYTNVDGQSIHSPAYSSGGVPAGATAQCADGTYSFSTHRQGTCSHHGGVAKWL